MRHSYVSPVRLRDCKEHTAHRMHQRQRLHLLLVYPRPTLWISTEASPKWDVVALSLPARSLLAWFTLQQLQSRYHNPPLPDEETRWTEAEWPSEVLSGGTQGDWSGGSRQVFPLSPSTPQGITFTAELQNSSLSPNSKKCTTSVKPQVIRRNSNQH